MKTNAAMLPCNFLTMLLLWGLSTNSQAVTIEVIKAEAAPNDRVNYTYRITNFGPEQGASPCSYSKAVYNTCLIQMELRTARDKHMLDKQSWHVPTRPDSSMGDLYKELNRQGFQIPYTGQFSSRRPKAGEDLCVTMFYAPTGSRSVSDEIPMSSCVPVPKIVTQCRLSGNGRIDHGEIRAGSLEGATATTHYILSCSGKGRVLVKTTETYRYGVSLRSDGTLYTKIKINDMTTTLGGAIFNITSDRVDMVIKSTLVTRGRVKAGPFYGSTVIILDLDPF
jgi:hypothetical protein